MRRYIHRPPSVLGDLRYRHPSQNTLTALTTKGDIGETAEIVEQRLENHFQLAHKWGCVLLLDEAE